MKTDLRSDTFTQPGEAMKLAMLHAKVGDDVFGEDPTVNELEAFAAGMFGMEAAVFCPSGTMTNQIAVKCHTQPGDEVICDANSHVYVYEGGGIAFNSGCQVRAVAGNRGLINAAQVAEYINPIDVYKAKTSLVVLENTSNRGGGSYYDLIDIENIRNICLSNNLKLHLDGARLFNALSVTGETAQQYGDLFDSISICLSKGLGAPVGSLLLGDFEFIARARRIRKVFGGGMRQAGFLAAAGLYALQNNVDHLQVDHIHAKQIAEALLEKNFVGKMLPVSTNIIIFEVSGAYDPKSFCAYMEHSDILCLPISATQVRMVLHLDVRNDMVRHVVRTVQAMV